MRNRPVAVLAIALVATLAVLPAGAAQEADALFAAVQESDLEAVRVALDSGVAVDSKNRYGSTALFFAADRGSAEIVALLLERGADANVSDTFYQATPLVWAMDNGHTEIALLLLQHGSEGVGQVLMQSLQSGDTATARAAIATGPLPRPLRDQALQIAEDNGHDALATDLRDAAVVDAPAPAPFVFDPAQLPRFEGMYRNEDAGVVVEIAAGDGHLLSTSDDVTVAYAATGPNAFAGPQGERLFFGGRGGVIEWAQLNVGDSNTGLSPVDPDEADLIRLGDAADESDDARYAGDPNSEAVDGWPSFRGHDGSGSGDGKDAPINWDADSTAGVIWKTPMPGIANSSPIAWGDHVFVTSAVSSAGDNTIKTGLYGDVAPVDDLSEHRFFVTAIHRTSGAVLWERDVYVGVPMVKRHTKSSQANSSPVTDGNVVVTLFGSVGMLVAFDFDGTEVWRTDLGPLDSGWFYDPDYQWGHSASPVIYDDTVIVQADVQKGSLPTAPNAGARTATRSRPGAHRWSTVARRATN